MLGRRRDSRNGHLPRCQQRAVETFLLSSTGVNLSLSQISLTSPPTRIIFTLNCRFYSIER